MYKEICDFAKAKGLTPLKNTKTTKIAAYVVLDKNGTYEGIEVIPKEDRTETNVPDFGSYSRVEKQPNPIVEKLNNILNVFEDSKCRKYPYYITTMERGDGVCPSLTTLWTFLSEYANSQSLRDRVKNDVIDLKLKDSDVISFRIEGDRIEKLDDWRPWVDAYVAEFDAKKGRNGDTEKIISIVSGELQTPCPAQSGPEIKNVPNDIKAAFGIGSGVYIESLKEPSYQSYGFDGATGTQMGLEDAETIAAGFEYLFNHEDHRNKNFGTVYFYTKFVENLIDESFNQDEDEIEEMMLENTAKNRIMTSIFNAVITGDKPLKTDDDCEYYMLQFESPTRSRYYLSNEYVGKYNDLIDSLYHWYNDTHIIDSDKGIKKDYTIKKFYNILLNCINNPNSNHMSEDVENELKIYKAPLLRTIYYNEPMPVMIYLKALARIDKAMRSGNSLRRVWIQILKCYLNRKGANIMPELSDYKSKAYACGRLFAAYEQMQWRYNPNLNKDLAQSYFSAAMKQPGIAFVRLAELGNVYIKNIKGAGYFYSLIGEITSIIGESFPKTFTRDEQGEFVLGYYQQKAEFMKKAPAETTNNSKTNVDTLIENA